MGIKDSPPQVLSLEPNACGMGFPYCSCPTASSRLQLRQDTGAAGLPLGMPSCCVTGPQYLCIKSVISKRQPLQPLKCDIVTAPNAGKEVGTPSPPCVKCYSHSGKEFGISFSKKNETEYLPDGRIPGHLSQGNKNVCPHNSYT